MYRLLARLSVTAIALIAIVALAGCATPSSAPVPQDQSASQGAAAGAGETPDAGTSGAPASASASALTAMGLDQIRSEIDSSFPVETPVPEGEVVRGAAQGPDAWDYELVVSAPVSTVVEWYRAAYASRSWTVTDERVLEGGGAEITLQKGGAGTRVTATPEGDGTRVVVVLGIGESVLLTQ
jgi:hypothetical protein